MTKIRPTAPLLSLLLLTTFYGAKAQTGAAEPAPVDLPAFEDKLEVAIVEVPFLARNRRGEAVTDLALADVVVKESGKRRTAVFLDRLADRYQVSDLPAVRLFVGAPGGPDGPVSSTETPPRNAVFFLDVQNDSKLGKRRAAAQLQQFALADLDPSYRIAVLSYDGEVHEESAFTDDRRQVVRAIESAFDRTPRPELDLATRVRQQIDRFRDCAEDGSLLSTSLAADETCLRATAVEYSEERRRPAVDFLRGLEGLVRFVSGLEGRKTVFAVSHGISIDPAPEILEAMKAVLGDSEQVYRQLLYLGLGEGPQTELRELLELAYRSEVTIHFVDRMQEPAGERSARQDRPLAPGTAPTKVAFEAEQHTLREIAETTGGVFVEALDVRQGLNQARALEEGAYVVGFAVDGPLSAARLATVEVDVDRSGVRVAHRSAHRGRRKSRVASATASGAIQARVAFVPLEKAAPLLPAGISATTASAQIHPFVVRVELESLGYRPMGSSENGASSANEPSLSTTFTLHVRLTLDDGPGLAESYHLIEHAVPSNGPARPILFTGWIDAPPGEYRLEVKVQDPRAETSGEAVARVEIGTRETS